MLSLFAKVCVPGELFNYIDKLPLPRELLISILWSMSTGIKLDFKNNLFMKCQDSTSAE